MEHPTVPDLGSPRQPDSPGKIWEKVPASQRPQKLRLGLRRTLHTDGACTACSLVSVLNCRRKAAHGAHTGQEGTWTPSVDLVADLLGTFSDGDIGKGRVCIRSLGLSVSQDTVHRLPSTAESVRLPCQISLKAS